jgi:hypothetical protein
LLCESNPCPSDPKLFKETYQNLLPFLIDEEWQLLTKIVVQSKSECTDINELYEEILQKCICLPSFDDVFRRLGASGITTRLLTLNSSRRIFGKHRKAGENAFGHRIYRDG